MEQLKTIKMTSDTDEAKNFKSKLDRLIDEISMVNKLLMPTKKPNPPTFELYEIVMTDVNTKLIRVDLPKK